MPSRHCRGIVIITITIHSPCNCMNDADSGTAARVWRSPLSSTTPSTGIPARRPRRRRARSCLSLTPFNRDPRDRSTLRTLPGRESTYEHTLVVSWYTPSLLQMMIRLPPPSQRFSFVCPSCCFCLFRCNERRPHRNGTPRSRVSDPMQINAALFADVYSHCRLRCCAADATATEYAKRRIASVEPGNLRGISLLAVIEPRRASHVFHRESISLLASVRTLNLFSTRATCSRDIHFSV